MAKEEAIGKARVVVTERLVLVPELWEMPVGEAAGEEEWTAGKQNVGAERRERERNTTDVQETE